MPAGATAEEMQGPRAGEVYSSMIVDRPPVPDLLGRTRTSFDFRMAPLVVLTGPSGEDRDGNPEYREHVEVVIYDLGENVWHHTWVDDGPTWYRAGWGDFRWRRVHDVKYLSRRRHSFFPFLCSTSRGVRAVL